MRDYGDVLCLWGTADGEGAGVDMCGVFRVGGEECVIVGRIVLACWILKEVL